MQIDMAKFAAFSSLKCCEYMVDNGPIIQCEPAHGVTCAHLQACPLCITQASALSVPTSAAELMPICAAHRSACDIKHALRNAKYTAYELH